MFLLLDRFGGELLEGGGHDINVPSLEEDKIAGRLNGNVFLERKVQTVFAGDPLKGFDVAIMIKGSKISAEVLKKALDKFVQEIEKAQKKMQQTKPIAASSPSSI